MNLLRADQDLTRHSYYAATAERGPAAEALHDAIDCDVAIVGGGLAGLSAAVELAERGLQVCLLEARRVAWGASGRNGGQAIHGLACDQAVIEAQLGLGAARSVWAMTLEAIELIHQRRHRYGIDCDWQSGWLGLAVSARKGDALRRWQQRMHDAYGFQTTWIEPAEMPRWIASPRYHSGLHDPRSGHLHPLKYSLGLADAAQRLGVRIHEHTPVESFQPGSLCRLHTPHGDVRARQVLLAGNVYLHGLAPRLERRIMPVGTYVVCSERLDAGVAAGLIPSRSAVCDTNFVLDYFRPTPDDRLLFGGRVSYSTRTPRRLAESMRRRMAQAFPQLSRSKVDYAWGGFVDITMNRAPDFGRFEEHANVYYVQGFSGHGLALSGLAGRLVAEAMTGDASRFDVFARLRHREFPGGRWLRMPSLVLGMAFHRLRDLL